MAGEWRTATVQELVEDGILERPIDGNHGEIHPKASDFVERGIPFIMASDLIGGRVDTTHCAFISEEQARSLRKGFARQGDVLISHKATMGRTAFVDQIDAPFLMLTPQVTYYRVKDQSRLSAHYLKLYFDSPSFQRLFETWGQKGSTRAYLGITSQLDLPIVLPPPDEQRAIAHILGTLDDKIELNRRLNETLEAMARALFKSWFVDFDPVRAKAEGRDPGLPKPLADLFPARLVDSELGEIPEGWEVATIGSVADVVDCLHSKKPERRESGFPLLQLSNVRDDGLIDMQEKYLIDEADYQKWVSRMEASPGDCVITNVGRVGAVAQMPSGEKAALGRNMTGIRCKLDFPFPTVLIECLLSQAMKDEIVRKMDTGTILDALNVRNIPKLRFVRPRAREMLDCFERTARPIRERMERQHAETRTLAALRDTLLPKLISGQLRVKAAAQVAMETAA